MYIKQIIIQGFKSYKDQTVIEPFSPKHNVIVGRNGSGKSNFFAAIRFVLSDAYTQMNKEERQGLLHEGTGAAVMSAFVEIIFDNSDDRFPTGKPELILRRTIGMKKDEYSLDRKNATKADVMNLLESAGFSRSNPYYIVPQGRVTALTNMKDAERLVLLKEVAGTQVYEARRTESLKIMNETNNKREQIDELLDYIRERLSELESEKDELRQYQERDKDRRCLQYTIDHQEQLAIQKELESLEEQRQTGMDDTDDRQEQFLRGEKALEQIDAELGELKQQVEFLRLDKTQLEDERKEAARAKAKVELEVKRHAEGQSAVQSSKKQLAAEFKSVKASIADHEKQLAHMRPNYESKLQQEMATKSQLDDAEAMRQRLYAKQGRGERFTSRRQRDEWLQREIDDSYPQLSKIKAVRVQTTEDLAQLDKAIATTEQEIKTSREQLEGRGGVTEEIQSQIEEIKAKRNRFNDERKELWRHDAKLQSVVSNAEAELRQAEQSLSHTMDQNTSRGLMAVRRIQRQQKLNGVYGTLAELCEVNDGYRKAVEATAGQSLFHYVVDNDETATKLIEALQKERSGRITFIPLNRVNPKRSDIPNANDAVPLLKKISFDPIFEKAFEQVFGSTIVCPNLMVAGQYARSHGVNGVTLEGDRSDRKGAFTGGYQDARQSRLQAMKSVTKWREECDNNRDRLKEIQKTLEQKDQEITGVVGELRRLEQKSQQLESSYGPLRQDLRSKSQALQKLKDDVESKSRAKTNIEANMKALTDQQAAHEAEIKTDFKKALTQAEETQLENLSSTVQDLQRAYSSLASDRSDFESRKTILEIELSENLCPRLDQLQGADNESQDGGTSTSRDLTNAERELKRTTAVLDKLAASLEKTEVSIDGAVQTITSLQNRRSETLTAQNDIANTIEKSSKRLEKSHQKRRILQQRATEVAQTIRDLGILPSGVEKFAKLTSEKLVKRLHKVNEELKKYGHVNKKAFEQYNNFTIQRDNLTKRRAELEASASSIEELIGVLDQRKDEAIERTFKQVSREFALVFEKLVPAGRGRLIIQRRAAARDAYAGDDEEGQAGGEGTENYTGVGISVSFNSRHDDQQRIQQLSGGQKSLCALTLIFAIQRCDPAPFYLFDEIDANLDAQYRTAVAQMLHEISEQQQAAPSQSNGGEGSSTQGGGSSGGQFICTTFRPEMLLVAEKTYGVRYQRNKSSSVVVVSKEEALQFVEGEKQ